MSYYLYVAIKLQIINEFTIPVFFHVMNRFTVQNKAQIDIHFEDNQLFIHQGLFFEENL